MRWFATTKAKTTGRLFRKGGIFVTKNLALVLSFLALCALLTACGTPAPFNKNKLEKSTEIVDDWVEQVDFAVTDVEASNSNKQSIQYSIYYETETPEATLTTGLQYSLEVEIDGEWYVVPIKKDASYVRAIAVVSPCNEMFQMEEDLSQQYKPLPSGTYRLIKFYSCTDVVDRSICLAAEFSIP